MGIAMSLEENLNLINETLDSNGIKLRESADVLLARLSERLIATNELVNLTSIDTPEGVALLHFADSLTLLPYLEPGETLLDVGSGAGFPALPIAIAMPDVRVTALDATQKKIAFAADAAGDLALRNFSALCGRAEVHRAGPPYR